MKTVKNLGYFGILFGISFQSITLLWGLNTALFPLISPELIWLAALET